MQKDLFGSSGSIIPNQSKTDFLERHRLSLRLDQALVAAIMLLIVYVLVFSFGVETGKRYAMAELKAERLKREQMAQEFRQKMMETMEAQNRAAETTQAAQSGASPAAIISHPAANNAEEAATGGEVESPVQPASAKPAATASPAPRETASSADLPAGKFTIQMITYTSKDVADKEIKRLASKGYRGFIIPKGKFNQVCVNGFETRDKANQTLNKLKTEGIVPKDAYVRSLA